MKLFAIALLLIAPGLIWAQSIAPNIAQGSEKVSVTKPAANKLPSGVRRSALKVVEEVTPVDEDLSVTLTEAELELAKRVHIGAIPCELGATVIITPSTKQPGFFRVQTQTVSFRMHPVESRTGAIRLEDPRAGAMWLQLGNKSMLMSQKLGRRLADDCMAPDQAAMALMMKNNPLPSILDAPANSAKQ